jgi:hypothetical protein
MAYQKRHYFHSFIIIGYELEEKKIICIDSYITADIIKVDYDNIKPGIRNFGTIQFFDVHIPKLVYYKALIEDAEYVLNNDCCGNIIKFANEVKERLNFSVEFDGYSEELYALPLLDSLKTVYTRRYGYGYMLEYVGKITGNQDLIDISKSMFSCVDKWKILRSALLRMSMRPANKSKLDELVNSIYDIANLERDMALNIKSISCVEEKNDCK